MKAGIAIMLLSGACAASGFSLAADKSGVSFSHKDWELACDNTGTCRAAGYQVDAAEPAVSLLLTRVAGPRQEVTAQIQLGSYGDDDSALAKGVTELAVNAGGRAVGTIRLVPGAQASPLSDATLAALMPALLQSSEVRFSNGKKEWKLSTAGVSAVLLKMDEYQGRIGTVGAIVRKGSKPEDGVLKPVAAPVVIAAPVPKEGKETLLQPVQRAALLKELRKVASADDCGGLHEEKVEFAVARLSGTKLVASVVCESFAYNQTSMFWVINATAPYAPVSASGDATAYANGQISSASKGRGLGDCWSSTVHTWDGVQFVRTSESTTGMCRLVAPGGAWELPTFVTTVRKSASKAR
ncbi:MAG: DUF1176 domain-containing protein [Pseudomonadota bacterium]|nr:DUF1176 domain-containing protein [Pseudomonadota bacterium]